MRSSSILYAAALVLVASAPLMADDSNDFQKQMMNNMMKQYQQQIQVGQKQLPASASSETAKQGKEVFNDPSLGTNGKSCGSCHSEGKKPLDGSIQPDSYTAAYIQYCYGHALGGQKVIDRDKLNKIMSYFVSFRKTSASTPFSPIQPSQIPSPSTQTPGSAAPAPATPAPSTPMPKTEENW